MEENLLAAILGNANDQDIEYIILDNILINSDNVERQPDYFDLNNLTDEEIRLNFRFDRADIHRLVQALRIPEEIVTETGNRISGLKALCILLKRLAYPIRLSDFSPYFGLSPQSLSKIINTLIDVIMEEYGVILIGLNALQLFKQKEEQLIIVGGSSMEQPAQFADQQEIKNIIQVTKGSTVLSFSLFYAQMASLLVLKEHTLEEGTLQAFSESQCYIMNWNKKQFLVKMKNMSCTEIKYMELLITPFPGRPEDLQEHQNNFNQSIKNLRVSVEWDFQKIVSLYAFIDF